MVHVVRIDTAWAGINDQFPVKSLDQASEAVGAGTEAGARQEDGALE